MEEKHIGEDISKNKTNNVKGRNVNNLGFVNLLLLLPLLFDYLQFCQSQIYLKILKALSLRTYNLNKNASLNCHRIVTDYVGIIVSSILLCIFWSYVILTNISDRIIRIIIIKSIQYVGNVFISSKTAMASKHFLGESVP